MYKQHELHNMTPTALVSYRIVSYRIITQSVQQGNHLVSVDTGTNAQVSWNKLETGSYKTMQQSNHMWETCSTKYCDSVTVTVQYSSHTIVQQRKRLKLGQNQTQHERCVLANHQLTTNRLTIIPTQMTLALPFLQELYKTTVWLIHIHYSIQYTPYRTWSTDTEHMPLVISPVTHPQYNLII